jgi:hypothetical protein
MVDITFGVIRRSRFIERDVFEDVDKDGRLSSWPTWKPKEGFRDLVMAFHRNKVLMRLTTSNLGSSNADHADIDKVLEDLHTYCDDNCTGFWTLTKSYRRETEWDSASGRPRDLGTGTGQVTIHFENEEDIEPFLKNCATVLKLST